MTKIILKVKEDGAVKNEQHEVTPIDIFQFSKTLKILKEALGEIEKDPAARAAFGEMMKDEEELGADEVMGMLTGALELLLISLPDHAFRLLSTLSGIPNNVLMDQPLISVFDVYDAILEVNDMEALVERGKKSFALTRQGLAFMKKVRQSTEAFAAKG